MKTFLGLWIPPKFPTVLRRATDGNTGCNFVQTPSATHACSPNSACMQIQWWLREIYGISLKEERENSELADKYLTPSLPSSVCSWTYSESALAMSEFALRDTEQLWGWSCTMYRSTPKNTMLIYRPIFHTNIIQSPFKNHISDKTHTKFS